MKILTREKSQKNPVEKNVQESMQERALLNEETTRADKDLGTTAITIVPTESTKDSDVGTVGVDGVTKQSIVQANVETQSATKNDHQPEVEQGERNRGTQGGSMYHLQRQADQGIRKLLRIIISAHHLGLQFYLWRRI